jgi:hypothetical protein
LIEITVGQLLHTQIVEGIGGDGKVTLTDPPAHVGTPAGKNHV